jgi:two-component system KDP operon response regulator KdpE
MSGPRVLVVDDEPEILRTLRLVLTGNGYEVVTARAARMRWRSSPSGCPT